MIIVNLLIMQSNLDCFVSDFTANTKFIRIQLNFKQIKDSETQRR